MILLKRKLNTFSGVAKMKTGERWIEKSFFSDLWRGIQGSSPYQRYTFSMSDRGEMQQRQAFDAY